MQSFSTILGLSVLALVLGATVLNVFISGPFGLFTGTTIAAIGWYYILPIAAFVMAALAIAEYPVFQRGLGAYMFVISGVLVGALFMAIYGVKGGQASEHFLTIAQSVGGGVSGGTVASLIILLRRLPNPDRPAAPLR